MDQAVSGAVGDLVLIIPAGVLIALAWIVAKLLDGQHNGPHQ